MYDLQKPFHPQEGSMVTCHTQTGYGAQHFCPETGFLKGNVGENLRATSGLELGA